MRLHKPSRSWKQELNLRRLVSTAVAEYRRPRYEDRGTTREPRRVAAHLLPLDEQGRARTSCPIEVQDFDERGITFQHPRPLHDRRALVVLEGPNQEKIAAEVDLTWCRFSQRGQYTSGGRFVSLVNKTA